MAELEYGEVGFDDDGGFEDDPYDARRDAELINEPSTDAGERLDPAELAELREARRVIEQFNANPMQSLEQIAQQMGLEVRKRGVAETQQAAPQQPSNVQKVEDLIEDESLKFLAPMIAKVAEKIADEKVRSTVEPLQRSQQEIQQRNRQLEYITAAQKLGQRVPDWQQREPEMQARLEFIRGALSGGPLEHPKYGSMLDMLHNWASGKDNAVREVTERYRQAPRNRAPTSGGDRQRRPDILKIVSEAKSPQDQMKIAFDEAVREVIG
jgi:hypothetical protein